MKFVIFTVDEYSDVELIATEEFVANLTDPNAKTEFTNLLVYSMDGKRELDMPSYIRYIRPSKDVHILRHIEPETKALSAKYTFGTENTDTMRVDLTLDIETDHGPKTFTTDIVTYHTYGKPTAQGVFEAYCTMHCIDFSECELC